MRKLLWLCLLLITPGLTWAQGGVPVEPVKVVDSQGRPRGGVLITFCQNPATGIPCSNLASIYSDPGLTLPINQGTNPLHTDGSGNFPVFYAAPGVYQYTITGVGITNTGQPFTATVAGTAGGDVTTTTAQTITGQKTFSQPIISTVSPGTAPLSIASTTVVPNLNAQLHNGLTAPASAIVGISDAQALTSKTFDISANTLKNSTNTAGHVPRNNGTNYVDAQLGFSDLGGTASTSQIGTGSPASGTYVDGGTGAWTPLPGTALFVVGNGGFLTINTGASSPVCANGTAGANCQLQTFATARTLIRIDVLVTVAASGCSTNAVVGVKDLTSASVVSSLTITSSGYQDSGALSVATTAGHIIGVGLLTAPSGCTGFPSFNSLSATFQ